MTNGALSHAVAASLVRAFGPGRVTQDVVLAPFTTFRVGGPADWFLETRSSDEILTGLRIAREAGVPVTILGGGSNVLVADRGIRGLVIRPRGGTVERVADDAVRADAAVTINGLVRWTITHGLAGIEEWAGTPGTVGGAVFGNAHFAGRLISEYIIRVKLTTRSGEVSDVTVAEMGFGYDRSRLQTSGELLLSADFRVSPGEPSELRETARRSLAYRKTTQPLNMPSAGCVFQNPEKGVDVVPAGIPWSAGALVDRAGMKGQCCGGARVSPLHGNFIVNDGHATAADIRTLIERCREAVRGKFGVTLREEIVYLGEFDR